MSNTDFHPEYIQYSKLWKRCRLAQHGQEAIRDAGEDILPKTSGMKTKQHGDDIYSAYKNRARFYSLVESYVDTIVGLAGSKELIIKMTHDAERVTKNNLSLNMLAQQVIENVAVVGGHILVNDAADNKPYIVQYTRESLVDWAVNDYNEYIWCKFQESYDADPDVTKRDMQIRYREYKLVDNKWQVYTTEEGGSIIDPPIDLELPPDEDGFPYCPITTIGSRNNEPNVDRIPSLPIVDACIAAYLLSADYRQSLHGQSQPTAWITGVNEDDVTRVLESGSGVGSLWAIGAADASVGYLEMEGNGITEASAEIERELNLAKEAALKVTTKDSSMNETATAVAEKSSSNKATIWTMFHSISQGVERALMILNRWQAYSGEVEFKISSEFSAVDASYNMLNSLNTATSAGNIPQSVMFQWMRDAKMTNKTDEELIEELQTQAPTGLSLSGV